MELDRAVTEATGADKRAYLLHLQGVTDGPKAERGIRALLDHTRLTEGSVAEAVTVKHRPSAVDRCWNGLCVATAAEVDRGAALAGVPKAAWVGFAMATGEEVSRRNPTNGEERP